MSVKNYFSISSKVLLELSVLSTLILSTGLAGAMPDNRIFAELLTRYNHNGIVDYAGFKKEEARLDAYLEILAGVKPEALSPADRFAFYANAYNAWTIKLILTGYPGVESIKDLGTLFRSPWKKKFVRLGGKLITLDTIEHDILRPEFEDPRVHMAVNCASKGCPPLWKEPFTGSRLNDQLNAVTRNFVNDPGFNRLTGKTLYVSRIFKWFSEDFNEDALGFIEQYAAGELKSRIKANRLGLKVKYLDYDWSLNGI